MNLVFKNKGNGNVSAFSRWLEAFNEIQHSLLIECDLKEQCFISKCFTTDHSIVKYAKISFENAGLEILNIRDNDDVAYSVEEWNEKYNKRIKIGIFLVLPKLISVVNVFQDTDFKFSIEFDVFKNPAGDEFHAKNLRLKSRSNDMKVKDCNISEFEQLDDDLFFNRINAVENPMTFSISKDAIKCLTKISSIFVSDAKKDLIKFYVKKDEETDKWALYAYDNTNESYNYLLGFLSSGEGSENDFLVYRANFFTAVSTKDDADNVIITLPAAGAPQKKVRVGSSDGTSYIVLAIVHQ